MTLGHTRQSITALIRNGDITRLTRGVYAVGKPPEGVDESVARHRMLGRGAQLLYPDGALAGHLDATALRAAAFAIVTSTDFTWSEDLVGEILHDWSAPEVNLQLSSENMERFRRWITRTEPYRERPSAADAPSGDHVLSETIRTTSRA